MLKKFWHTDRQTDTTWRHRPRLCIASRGKNRPTFLKVMNEYQVANIQWHKVSRGLCDSWASCLDGSAPELLSVKYAFGNQWLLFIDFISMFQRWMSWADATAESYSWGITCFTICECVECSRRFGASWQMYPSYTETQTKSIFGTGM